MRVELLEPQHRGLKHRRLCEAFVSLPDKGTDSGVLNCPLLDNFGTQVGHIRMVSHGKAMLPLLTPEGSLLEGNAGGDHVTLLQRQWKLRARMGAFQSGLGR